MEVFNRQAAERAAEVKAHEVELFIAEHSELLRYLTAVKQLQAEEGVSLDDWECDVQQLLLGTTPLCYR